jgi:cytochrome c peroxidase
VSLQKKSCPGFPSRFAWLFCLAIAFAASLRGNLYSADLNLRFEHTFDGSLLALGSLRYPLASGETISVTRLSYLLSGFGLERANGGWLELSNEVAWIALEKRRSSFTLTSLPAGEYRSLRFAVGLDARRNLGDPAKYPADHPLNPNLNGLHWSWQGGYIFMALEGMHRGSTNQIEGYSYHFARETNRTLVTLPLQVKLATQTDVAAVTIRFDLSSLLSAPRQISPRLAGSSTHSRDGDPIAAALRANLPGAFQVREVVGEGVPVAGALIKPLYLPAVATAFPFQMSARFPIPDLPKDNPLLVERVNLGKHLFENPLLSRDGKHSCGSCHDSGHAFSDARRFSLGVEDKTGTRNAMPLFNLAWKSSFFWDGRAPSLRAQALAPIQDHLEMDESLTNLVAKLRRVPAYSNLFSQAFGTPEITSEKIGLALENFVLTLTSFDSKFDRAMSGRGELSELEKQGFELFFTEFDPRMERRGADCFHCHGGALFADQQFHNNGLDGSHELDPGRFKVTTNRFDLGKFSTPSLRNVALTAPYMHDGRFQTLEEVVEHYSSGVKRSETLDPNLAKHPLEGLRLSEHDKAALVAFLKTLTDEKYVPSSLSKR